MSESVNIHYAKTHLSALIKRVMEGASITISNAGTPVAKLVPLAQGKKRKPGGIPLRIDKSFFEPLPDTELDGWER